MKHWLILLAALTLPPHGLADQWSSGDLHVMAPWSRALPPVSANGAAYFSITNRGATADPIVGASSPKARKVEMHAHLSEGGMMRMREIAGGVAVAPGETVSFEPGGKHVMLIGLTSSLKAGETFPVTLEFEHAPPLEITVTIKGMGASGAGQGHSGHGAAPAMPAHQGHAGHGSMAPEHDGHDHDRRMDMPADRAPSLSLGIRDLPSGGLHLSLAVERLRFAREHADGAHVPGEGHAHLYLDGKKLRRVYGPEDMIESLMPGTHEIQVGLYTNDHAAYAADGVPVSARYVLRVAAGSRSGTAGAPVRRVDLDLAGGRLDPPRRAVRVTRGDTVELGWTSDASREIHLHGYDLSATVAAGDPVIMRFHADLTGRFPVEVHGAGAGHEPVAYVEVHPQ